MGKVAASVDVAVPIRTAYDHWTRAEEFPAFLEELEDVRMVTDRAMRWRVKLGATTREFDVLFTEQVREERVSLAWTEKASHFATVSFSRIDSDHTRVSAELEVDAELQETWRTLSGDAGIASNRVKDYLHRLRDFAESHGSAADR